MADQVRRFLQARLLDIDAAQRALDEGAKVGESDVQLAAFSIPDTYPAMGNTKRQVIDHGAFSDMIQTRDMSTDPIPMFLDHGAYMVLGYTDSLLKIGRTADYREEKTALVMRGFWNLEKQVAREAYSDLLFDPYGTQFSFRNYIADEELTDGDDGFEHVTAIRNIVEATQCPFGAQKQTGPILGTAVARAALRSHSTPTYEGEWSGSSQVAALSNDAGASTFRRMFAWVADDSDPEKKGSYKFPHHTVEDGSVAGANVNACRAIIANLNGARNSAKIPDADRGGVYRHAARHLKDAGVDNIAPLRQPEPDAQMLETWAAENDEFAEILREVAGVDPDVQERDLTSIPTEQVLAFLSEDRSRFIQTLRVNPEMREVLQQIMEESTRPNAAVEFLAHVWEARKAAV